MGFGGIGDFPQPRLYSHQKQLLEFLEKMKHANYIEHSFVPGEKIVLRTNDHPGHHGYWDDSFHNSMINKVYTVEKLGSSEPELNTVNIQLDNGDFFWSSRFEPYIHDFKVGDKVVLRPKGHPGHDGSWSDALDTLLLGFDTLSGRTLTVSSFGKFGTIHVEEDEDTTRLHNISRFSLAFVGDVVEKAKEKAKEKEYTFTVGEKVVTRPHTNLVAYLDNKILTVETVETLYDGMDYLTLGEDEEPGRTHWASRFEPLVYDVKVGDKIVLRPKDHPGHDGFWDDWLDALSGRTLTVSASCFGTIHVEEEKITRPHNISRFSLVEKAEKAEEKTKEDGLSPFVEPAPAEEEKQEPEQSEHGFKVGDKVALKSAHDGQYPDLSNRILIVDALSFITSNNIKVEGSNIFILGSWFEPYIHDLKVDDKVVLRPNDHPGHRGWMQALDHLRNLSVLTVRAISENGDTLSIVEKPTSWHLCSRFAPAPEAKPIQHRYSYYNVPDTAKLRHAILDAAMALSRIDSTGLGFLDIVFNRKLSDEEKQLLDDLVVATRNETAAAAIAAEKKEESFTVGDMVMNLQNGDGPYPWKDYYRPENHRHATQDEIVVAIHDFKAGDMVVLRPKGHPGHQNRWADRHQVPLVGKVFTVEELRQKGEFVILVEETGQVSYFASRFEPLRHNFKAGDKVMLRPEEHPGHGDGWDMQMLRPLINKVLTVKKVDLLDKCLYLEGGFINYGLYISRFEPAPKTATAVDEKNQSVNCYCLSCKKQVGHTYRQQGTKGAGWECDECVMLAPPDDSKPASEKFKLRPDASRRTKQRWKAHQEGRCNSEKCRFSSVENPLHVGHPCFEHCTCRFCAAKRIKQTWAPASTEQAEGRLKRTEIMRCDSCADLVSHTFKARIGAPSDVWYCDVCGTCRVSEQARARGVVIRRVDKPSEPGIINPNPCQEVTVTNEELQNYPSSPPRVVQEPSMAGILKGEELSQGTNTPAVAFGLKTAKPAKPKVPFLTARNVLGEEVSNNYRLAARQVARTKAEVEIWDATFIPGLMVWHRYNHHSAILITETQPGFWTIETRDGSTENEVPISILTPVCPSIFIRSWLLLKRTLSKIFYKDVEITNSPLGNYTVQHFRGKLLAAMILSVMLAVAWPFIYSVIFPR
jgi:hypothetical protein